MDTKFRQYFLRDLLLSAPERGKRTWNGLRLPKNPVTLKRWRAGFFYSSDTQGNSTFLVLYRCWML